MAFTSGVYSAEQIPMPDYLRDPCPAPSLSSTGARKIITGCPAKFWHDHEHGSRDSKPLEFGRIAHRLVLEGKDITDQYTLVPDGFSEAHVKKHADLIDRIKENGKPPFKESDADAVRAMAKALREHEFAHAAFANGKAEQTLIWRDEHFGIWCRARLDWLPNGGTIVADYKTCRSARREELDRDLASYGYHQQAAWNMAGMVQLELCEAPKFLFVFQEKEPPYLITTMTLAERALIAGETLNMKAKQVFADCLRSGHWPGYHEDIIEGDLPGWWYARFEHQQGAGAFDLAQQEEAA